MKTSFILLLALVASFIVSAFARRKAQKSMEDDEEYESPYGPGVRTCIRRARNPVVSGPYDQQ